MPGSLLLWWGLDHREAAPEVHFVAVSRTRIESTVSTNGKVEPLEWAAARAETPGVVKGGQVLVQLDVTAAQSDLAAALAREQEARAESTTLGQGGKASQVANLSDSIRSAEVAVDVAQRNYESTQRLLAQQAGGAA